MIKTKKAIKTMKEYDPPTKNRTGKLRLDFNENSIGCSPKVIEKLRQITAEDLSIYPTYSKLLEKISEYVNVPSNQILATNGTDESIKCFFDTFVEENEEIIILSPTFAMFRVYADAAGARVKEIPYKKDLSFPLKELLSNINSKTKLVLIANPNNPTGTSINNRGIRRILNKNKDTLVIIDEAYYDFYGKTASLLLNNLAITRTLSKAFGLASIRLGFIVSNMDVIKDMKKVISPYSVNGVASTLAITALEDKKYVDGYVSEVNKSKEILYNAFKELNIKYFTSDTNFIIVNFGEDCNRIYNELKKRSILVRNRSKYPLLKGCLRMGIGTLEQTNNFLRTLKEILKKEALLFDMDGALVDVSESYRTAIQKTVEFFTNQEITPNTVQEFKKKGGYNNDWDLTEAIIINKGRNIEKQSIINKFQEIYLKVRDNEKWTLNKKILQKLKQKYKLGIITGRPKEEALYTLNKNQTKQFFEVIITMEDMKTKQKPDPFGIQLAIEQLNTKKATYIGDAIDDIMAANNADIDSIGVLPPGYNDTRLASLMKENGAKFILKDINEIEVLK